MISPARITELLSQRTALSPEDKRLLEQVAVRYPYFVPAQLLLATQRPNAAPALQALYHNPVLTARYLPPVKLKQPRAPEVLPATELPVGQVAATMPAEETTEPLLPEIAPEVLPQREELTETATIPEAAAEAASEPEGDLPEEALQIAVHPGDASEIKAAASGQVTSAPVKPTAEDPDILEQSNESPDVPSPLPVYTEDYFRFEGIEVGTELPAETELNTMEQAAPEAGADKEKSLMVMMSFTDWLLHYKKQSQSAKDEAADKQRVKSAWQREKLAAALQEEEDEIPEQVFEMAVNSLNQEEGLVSESLAAILAKQGKIEKAMEMYQKLSLKYPQKSAYFASQIEHLKREENQ